MGEDCPGFPGFFEGQKVRVRDDLESEKANIEKKSKVGIVDNMLHEAGREGEIVDCSRVDVCKVKFIGDKEENSFLWDEWCFDWSYCENVFFKGVPMQSRLLKCNYRKSFWSCRIFKEERKVWIVCPGSGCNRFISWSLFKKQKSPLCPKCVERYKKKEKE